MDRVLKAPIPPTVRPATTPVTPAAIPGPKPVAAAAPITQRAQPFPAASPQPQRNVAVLTPAHTTTTTGTYMAEAGGTVFDETKLRRGRAATSDASFDVKKLIIIASVVIGLLVVAYAVKQWQSNQNALSQQTAQDDARILQDVTDALSQSESLKNVHVDVKRGVVTLTGTVAKSYESEAAGNQTRDVLGVRSVINNIQVLTNTPEQHDRVWRSEQEKNASSANPQPANTRPAPTPAPASNPSGTSGRANRSAALQYVQQGYTQIGMRDYNSAISSFQRALALDPGNQAALNGLQKARAAKKGN
jgi:osmotically-inducible protein OsmY